VGAPERFAMVAQALGEQVDGLPVMLAARRSVETVRELCADVRIPGVVELGYDRERFLALMPKMAADALASGSPNNNPRVPTKEEIIGLYEELWA
jgi:alcohol dehydrogenase class IV